MLRTTIEHMDTNVRRPLPPQARFTCKACHKVFVLEDRYLQHECKQMKREAELKSPEGQTAWYYYQLWMRAQKRMPPPAQSFLTSKYFRTFISFVQFSKKVELPHVDKFIWLMVTKGFTPVMWTSDEVYTIYLEFCDRKIPPLEQATKTVETLLKYTAVNDMELHEVFDKINIQQIIHLLHVRKISPWLLLFSKSFKNAFVNRATNEQRIILESMIRPSYWPDKFAQYPAEVAKIKLMVAEMGI